MRAELVHFCHWLELTPFSRTLQDTTWIIAAVQTVHILAIAAVVGAMLMLHLRVAGVRGAGQPIAAAAGRYVPVLWLAIPILLCTGIVMICAEPARSLLNLAFQLKMAMLVAVLGVTVAFARPLRREPRYWDERRTAATGLASASLALWAGIVFCGRWIAYMGIH